MLCVHVAAQRLINASEVRHLEGQNRRRQSCALNARDVVFDVIIDNVCLE